MYMYMQNITFVVIVNLTKLCTKGRMKFVIISKCFENFDIFRKFLINFRGSEKKIRKFKYQNFKALGSISKVISKFQINCTANNQINNFS